MVMGQFKIWFIFGENKEKGTVDIADRDGDVLWDVPLSLANEIIKLRDKTVEKMENLDKETIKNQEPNQ